MSQKAKRVKANILNLIMGKWIFLQETTDIRIGIIMNSTLVYGIVKISPPPIIREVILKTISVNQHHSNTT